MTINALFWLSFVFYTIMIALSCEMTKRQNELNQLFYKLLMACDEETKIKVLSSIINK